MASFDDPPRDGAPRNAKVARVPPPAPAMRFHKTRDDNSTGSRHLGPFLGYLGRSMRWSLRLEPPL